MNYDYKRGWAIHEATSRHPFDAKAPYIDHGTGRPDPRRYHDPNYARAEWEKMWCRTWLLAGPTCDIREAGDYFRFDVGPESFIIVRGTDGDVNAHYNVCPHRGNRIVHDDFGAMDKFTCSFHSWSFGLDGSNQSVTDAETFRKEVLCHNTGLTRVRCEVVAGLVFITMNEDPAMPSARDWLGVVAEHLENYQISEMNVISHKRTEWAANWKTGVDAFYETYHLHAIHPETQGMMEDYFVQHDQFPNGMSRMYIPFARPSPRVADQTTVNPAIQMMLKDAGIAPEQFEGDASQAREAIQKAKRARSEKFGLGYERFTDAQLTDSVPYGVFPNVQMGCHVEGVFLMRFLPHESDPEKFYYDNIILYRHVDDPGYKVPDWMGLPEGTDTSGVVRPDLVKVPLGQPPELGMVLDQDSDLLPVVQQGLRSRGFRGPLWSEQEVRLRHFHAELDAYVEGDKYAPAGVR